MNDETKREASDMFSAVSAASVIYGIILIIISALIFANTKETYFIVTTFLGIYLLAKGIIDFVAVFNSRNPQRGTTLFISIVSFFSGVFIVTVPIISTGILVGLVVYFAGFIFILVGIMSLSDSIPIGIISIIIGILMFFFTREFAIGFAWLVASLFFLAGILTIVFGASLKNTAREIKG